MTPQQKRFKEANQRCRARGRMPTPDKWKKFGTCMSKEMRASKELEHPKPPKRLDGSCFRRKEDAIKKFAARNVDTISAFGGLLKTGSKGEFDSVNERYSLKGRRRVVNIQQAIAKALPSKAPYCLDEIDLDTLNETAPARHGGEFRLPADVEETLAEKRLAEEQARYYLEGARRRPRQRRRAGRR